MLTHTCRSQVLVDRVAFITLWDNKFLVSIWSVLNAWFTGNNVNPQLTDKFCSYFLFVQIIYTSSSEFLFLFEETNSFSVSFFLNDVSNVSHSKWHISNPLSLKYLIVLLYFSIFNFKKKHTHFVNNACTIYSLCLYESALV